MGAEQHRGIVAAAGRDRTHRHPGVEQHRLMRAAEIVEAEMSEAEIGRVALKGASDRVHVTKLCQVVAAGREQQAASGKRMRNRSAFTPSGSRAIGRWCVSLMLRSKGDEPVIDCDGAAPLAARLGVLGPPAVGFRFLSGADDIETLLGARRDLMVKSLRPE